MKFFRTNKKISSQAGNPRQWLAAYFSTRAHLASYESAFHCDPACTRPGCKDQDLHIPVNLVDLLGAALHRDGPVSALYRHNYALGLLAEARDAWLRLVSVKLKKPCPFLEHDLCSIYPVRPLPCVLFPEYLVNEGTFAAAAAQPHFKDYLCFRRPLRLSPERARAVAQLKGMWERENLVSSYYLFQHGSCHVDFSNLCEALGLEAQIPDGSASEGSPERIIPHRVLEGFFREHMAGCQPFAGIDAKILSLDNPEGQAQFLGLLQDDRLIRKLRHKRDDRALVYRFTKGKLLAKRRSLTPIAHQFCG